MDGWMDGKVEPWVSRDQGAAVCCRFLIECKVSSLILLSQSSPSPSLVRRTRNWTLEAQYLPRHQLYVRTDDTQKGQTFAQGLVVSSLRLSVLHSRCLW